MVFNRIPKDTGLVLGAPNPNLFDTPNGRMGVSYFRGPRFPLELEKTRTNWAPSKKMRGPHGCGSKFKNQGYTGFSLWLHVTRCHLGAMVIFGPPKPGLFGSM